MKYTAVTFKIGVPGVSELLVCQQLFSLFLPQSFLNHFEALVQ